MLAALAREGLAYVIVVLRGDAYARLQGSPALLELRDKGTAYDLTPPTPDELEEIVKLPVAACTPPLAFEVRNGLSLAARLVAETKRGDVLPLLQMTLARLYGEEEKRGDGLLRFDDYRGLDAAVGETADAAMAELGAAAEAELPKLVAGLVGDVGVDPVSGAPTPIIVPLDRAEFEARGPARRALIDAFVEARLLTGDEGARVRPVHDSLLRIWPRAAEIVKENASLIRVRRTLEPIVRDWSTASGEAKAAHLDLSPPLLAGAQHLLERFGDDLPQPMRAFIAEAVRRDEEKRARERAEQERRARDAEALAKARGRFAWALGLGLIVVLGLAVVAGWQWRSAETQRDRAERTLALATETANGLVFDLAQKSGTFRECRLGWSRTCGINCSLRANRHQGWLGQRDLSISYDRVGDVQVEQGDLAGALKSYRNSLAIADRLAKSDSGNAGWQRDLSVSYEEVGDVQVAQGDLAGALKSYRDSLAIRDRLAKSDPGNAGWLRGSKTSHGSIARSRRSGSDWVGAGRPGRRCTAGWGCRSQKAQTETRTPLLSRFSRSAGPKGLSTQIQTKVVPTVWLTRTIAISLSVPLGV